ncbi:MAG: hypothetical protein ACI9P9_000734 [Patescibacteria group bacterium]|jgi:hypothetical protein
MEEKIMARKNNNYGDAPKQHKYRAFSILLLLSVLLTTGIIIWADNSSVYRLAPLGEYITINESSDIVLSGLAKTLSYIILAEIVSWVLYLLFGLMTKPGRHHKPKVTRDVVSSKPVRASSKKSKEKSPRFMRPEKDKRKIKWFTRERHPWLRREIAKISSKK